MPRDLYAALGRPRKSHEGHGPDVPLKKSATQSEVEAAADAAIFRHHPDRNPSDDGTYAPGSASARFRDAKLARDVLCDPAKRESYDAGLWIDPNDPPAAGSGDPGWYRAVTDPDLREVLSGCVESACVLGGLDKDAAALAGDMAIGAIASAVETVRSGEPMSDRAAAAVALAGKKIKTPEGRAALREAGQSLRAAWRKVFV